MKFHRCPEFDQFETEVQRDAMRWRALLSSARIRIAGQDYNDYYWLEFWSSHTDRDCVSAIKELLRHVDGILGCSHIEDADDAWQAKRWHALLTSPLLSWVGCAGFTAELTARDDADHLHFGLEIGTTQQHGNAVEKKRASAIKVLTEYADWIIRHQALATYTTGYYEETVSCGLIDLHSQTTVAHDEVFDLLEEAARAAYGTDYDDAPESGSDEYPGSSKWSMREDVKDAFLTLGVGLVGLVRLKNTIAENEATMLRISPRRNGRHGATTDGS